MRLMDRLMNALPARVQYALLVTGLYSAYLALTALCLLALVTMLCYWRVL